MVAFASETDRLVKVESPIFSMVIIYSTISPSFNIPSAPKLTEPVFDTDIWDSISKIVPVASIDPTVIS